MFKVPTELMEELEDLINTEPEDRAFYVTDEARDLFKNTETYSAAYLNYLKKYNEKSHPVISLTIEKYIDTLNNNIKKLYDVTINTDGNYSKDLLIEYNNSLLEQLKKIEKQELIDDGVDIMLKQVKINREQATRFLVENNYNPVNAIVAFLNYKPEKQAQTYLTFQLNQHELINDLTLLSKSGKLEYTVLNNFSEMMKTKVQSFVCMLINSEKDIHKMKKFSTLPKLYNKYVNNTSIIGDNLLILKMVINNQDFGLLINKAYIYDLTYDSLTPSGTLNKVLTTIMRNLKLITDSEVYMGPSLFVNNFFLD